MKPGTAFFDTWIIPSINLESGTATLSKSADKLSGKLSLLEHTHVLDTAFFFPLEKKKADVYFVQIKVFLDKNSGMWAAGIDLGKWNSLFRTSLRLEVALFDSAFSPYGKRL